MRILATADLHLTRCIRRNIQSMTLDSYVALEQLVAHACSIDDDLLVVIAGDIFNTNSPTDEDLGVWFTAVHQILSRPRPTLIVVTRGNHDPGTETGPGLATCASIRGLVEPVGEIVAFGPLRIYAIPFGSNELFQAQLAAVPGDVNVLVMHSTWKEAVGGLFGHQVETSQIPAAANHKDRLVVIGDVHIQHEEFVKERHLTILSPGAPYPTSITEGDSKRILDIAVSLEGSFVVDSVPITSRRIARYEAFSEATLRSTMAAATELQAAMKIAQVPEKIRKPLVDVQFYTDLVIEAAGAKRSALSLLEDTFTPDWCHLQLRPVTPVQVLQRGETMPTTITEAIQQVMAGAVDKPTATAAQSLLTAANPVTLLDQWEVEAGLREAPVKVEA